MTQVQTYIKTIPFTDFKLWDVKRYIKYDFRSDYELVSLSELITERSEKVKLFEFPDEEFRILGVSNKEGLFDNYIELGKNINQPYKKVYDGDLAYNPYRINVGSIGLKTSKQEYDLISPAYVVFSCNPYLLPEYLYILFKTKTFDKIINDSTTGSVRQNLKFSTLKNIKIPLPSLTEQNRIVANYNQKIALAKQQALQAEGLTKSLENDLYSCLKLKKLTEKRITKGLHFTSLEETERWDLLYLQGNIPVLDSKYPIKKFSNVISRFNKGMKNESIRINSKEFPDNDFIYIGMEHIEKSTGFLIENRQVKGREIKSQTLRVPRGFFLYGKLRPYLNKYWLNNTELDNLICSSEFFVFDLLNHVDKLFFKYVLSSSFIQHQISDKTSGARMPRINENIFMNLQFPLPPLEVQKQISNYLSQLEIKIKRLKKEADNNKSKALEEFEQEIFSS